jgi:hypothetical protein
MIVSSRNQQLAEQLVQVDEAVTIQSIREKAWSTYDCHSCSCMTCNIKQGEKQP